MKLGRTWVRLPILSCYWVHRSGKWESVSKMLKKILLFVLTAYPSLCMFVGILWRVVYFLLLGLRTKERQTQFLQLCFVAKFFFSNTFLSSYTYSHFFLSLSLYIYLLLNFFSFLSFFHNPKLQDRGNGNHSFCFCFFAL